MDKVIDMLADVDCTLRDELHGLCADVYALHAREGVKVSEDTEDQCDDSHQPHNMMSTMLWKNCYWSMTNCMNRVYKRAY